MALSADLHFKRFLLVRAQRMVLQETSLEADVLERGCTFLDESFHRGLDAFSGQRGRREGMDWILFGLVAF